MGKYAKNNKKSSKNTALIMALAVVVGLLAVLMVAAVVLSRSGFLPTGQTEPSGQSKEPTVDTLIVAPSQGSEDSRPTVQTTPVGETKPTEQMNPTDPTVPGQVSIPTEPNGYQPTPSQSVGILCVGEELELTMIGTYTGLYMEDGTDEIVSGVLMVTLKNASENDLQFLRFELEYTDFTAQFEATNVPAGASVILLEKNRHAYAEEKAKGIEVTSISFFNEPMSLMEDRFEFDVDEQSIGIKNISNNDIQGDIYIYYKKWAQDTYYGGITFRAKLSGGLKAGKTEYVVAGHFDPVNCQIIAVTVGE